MKKKLRSVLFRSLLAFIISIPLGSFEAVSQEKEEKSLILKADDEAYVLRCFSEYNSKVKAHSIAVGDPTQLHYLYDSDRGALLKVWKGEFADVAKMWINRGGGFFATNAPTEDVSDAPSVAVLTNKNQEWPDSVNYKFKGYKVDKSGRPAFKYLIDNLVVEDKILPLDSKDGLSRTFTISGTENQKDMYLLIAEGGDIRKSAKNTYTITGKDFTIRIDDTSKLKPVIRESKGRKELLVQIPPAALSSFKYSIIF
jgi:hypothetical protein